MYINCKTYYSFRYGTMSAKTLVKAAVEVGVQSLALTNINSTCDVWEFVQACNEEGIKPITGVEIRNGDKLLYILLAANNKGMAWIHEFLSLHLSEKIEFLEISTDLPFFDELEDGFVIYPFGAKEVEKLFSNERIGIKASEINKLYGVDVKKYNSSYIVRQPVTFLDEIYFGVHRLLRAIDNNVLYAKLPIETQCGKDEGFVPPNELLEAFKNYTGIVTNTYKMMEACNIKMEFFTYKNKKFFSGSKEDDKVLLAKLANDGLEFRFGRNNKVAKARVEKELKIIDQLNFNAYFLMTYDLIRYAQSRNYFHVGRGSGANSIVAYCLRITDVDPIELDLYFERFLNPYRTSPPDFDIDFSWTDRDEVTTFRMFEKIQKIVIITMLTVVFLLGLLCIYRAELNTKDLTVIVDKVVNKKILYFRSAKSGRHYCLAFGLANSQNKIAINLGTKSQADKDSAIFLIDTGKEYKFYLDPTVLTDNGINWGIDKIDRDNKEVYKKSNKRDLYLGIFISLISLSGISLILKFKKKNKIS